MALKRFGAGPRRSLATGQKDKVPSIRHSKRGGASAAELIGKKIAPVAIAKRFGFSKSQLALTAGLSTETLYRPERSASRKTQGRLREMLEIVNRISDWAGSEEQAMAWYRAQPIPAFGGRTAESLVKEGRAADVRDYLDQVALGGFA
jgi:hypothetical protein